MITRRCVVDCAVFINYRGEDSTNTAAWLYTALTDRFGDERIFLDAESIPAGADFIDELLGHVRSARVMLVVIGPRWLTATDPTTGHRLIDDPVDWIHREIAEAFAAGVRVIPVLTDHATLPSEADLPPDIAALSRCQYRDLRRREPTSDLARIAADLAKIDPELDSTTHHKQADETSWQAHWLPRARGSEPQSDAGVWYFTGRVAARQRVCDWLADPSQPVLVVTGGPGTGKSALLAHLLVSSDPAWADTVPTQGPRLPVGAFDLAIHVSGLSCEDVVRRVAHAMGLNVTRPPELLAAMRQRHQTSRPPVVILADAVEEAASIDEARDIAVLLRNLAGTGAVRVLAGVRTAPTGTQRARIPGAFGATIPRLSLESREFQRNEDVADYVRHRLTHDDTRGHYRHRSSEALRNISWAIARRASYNFLIAQLTTLWLTQATTPPLDLAHPDWEQHLPETVGEAMEQYLRHCGPEPDLVRRILTALAFSRGNGLPYGRTWLTISDALHPAHNHTLAELETVFHSAANYLLERTDDRDDQPTYRLYHHALDEHLRDHCTRYTPQRSPLRAITHGLLDAIPGTEHGRRDWAAADAYTRIHLSGHAAQAHQLDDVLTDPGFLVHAEPGPLLSALPYVRTERGQLTAAIYRLSEHHHRRAQPAERCRLLAFDAARCDSHDLQDVLNTLLVHLTGPGRLAWRASFATASKLPTAKMATLTGHTQEVTAVAVAELDGRPIAVTGSTDRTVRMWDLIEQREIATLTGHHEVKAVAVAELDGRPIALVGGEGGAVRMWDLIDQREIATLTGHHDIRAVAVAELDGRPIALVGGKTAHGVVRMWDLIEQREIATLTGHTSTVEAVAVAELDGRPIAVTSCWDRKVRVWDLTTQRKIGTLKGHTEMVLAVAVAELDGRPLAVTGSDIRDETVRVWDLTKRQVLASLTGHSGEVRAVAVAELDGRPIAVTGGADKAVRVWDLTERRPLAPLTAHTQTVKAVAVAELDGRPIAVTGSWDQTVRVWDLTERRPLTTFTDHTALVQAVAVAELDGHPIAVTASHDYTVRVWDLATQRALATLRHTSPVRSVAVAELDGRPIVVAGSWDTTVRVWDLTERRALATLTGHTMFVEAVAVAELDGRPIAVTGSMDQTVRVWDIATQRALATLTGHTSTVEAVAVAELDGRPIAVTGGADKTVRVWDLTGRRALATLAGHTDTVHAVAVAELDGRPIAVTGSFDQTVRVWDLQKLCCLDEFVMPGPTRTLAFGTCGMLVVGYGFDIAVFNLLAPLNARSVPKLSSPSRAGGIFRRRSH